MPNAGENFQAQRPQPLYMQTQNVAAPQNIGAIAGFGGLLNLYKTVTDAINGSPQDNYYKALETSQKDSQLKGAYDLITTSDDPEARAKIRAGIIKMHPEWEGVIPEDVSNLKAGDFESNQRLKAAKRMATASEDVWNANHGGQPGAEQPQGIGAPVGKAVAGADSAQQPQYEKNGLTQWSNTENPPEPTEVYSGKGEAPVPDEQYLQGNDNPQGQKMEPADAPQATEVPVDPNGEVFQEDPNVAKINAASAQSGYPASRMYVSEVTGEVKLRPEYVNAYPELPRAAFEDVLLAGPEDAAIATVNAAYIPHIKQAQNDLLQAGAAYRTWRSYELGIAPKEEDQLAMSLSNAQMDIYKAEAAAKLGIIDPESISPFSMQAYAYWQNPLTTPEVRSDPRLIEEVKKVLAMPPTLRKLHMDAADTMVDNDIDFQKWQAQVNQFDQTAALKARQIAAEEQKNAWNYSVQSERNTIEGRKADASTIQAKASLLQAGGDLTPEERQRKFDLTMTKLENEGKLLASKQTLTEDEIKRKVAAGDIDPRTLQIANDYLGKQGALGMAQQDNAWKQVQSTESLITKIDSDIRYYATQLPTDLQTILAQNRILDGSKLKGAELAAYKEATKDTKTKETVARIEALQNRKTRQEGLLENRIGNFNKISEENQAKAKDPNAFLRAQMATNPEGTVRQMENAIVKSLQVPGSDKAFRYLNGLGESITETTSAEDIAGMLVSNGVKMSNADIRKVAAEWKRWNDKKRAVSKPVEVTK